MAQDQELYRCDECGETFDSDVEWELHNRKIHSRYTCQNCREAFDAEDEFAAHTIEKHPEQPHSTAKTQE